MPKFRVNNKDFQKAAVTCNGCHFLLGDNDLTIQDGVLYGSYWFYDKHMSGRGRYGKWRKDLYRFDDTVFLSNLLKFAIKEKVINVVPDIASQFISAEQP